MTDSDVECGVVSCAPHQKVRLATCCGFFGVTSLIVLVTILASIHELGPEEQMVVKDPSGHWTQNGPYRGVLLNVYAKNFRKAALWKPEEYATVNNLMTGEPRHEDGPQLLFLGAYDELVRISDKLVLHKERYAVLKNEMTGEPRHVAGPTLLHPGLYDKVVDILPKYVLQKDEYLVMANMVTGAERVVRGPRTFVPEPLEGPVGGDSPTRATFLDEDTAVVVLNRSSGRQHLVQRGNEDGLYIPAAYEEILKVQQIVRVLPHETVVVRDSQGQLTVRSGLDGDATGFAFFLPPFSDLLEMTWSSYSTVPQDHSPQQPSYTKLTKIDMRAKKMVFQYEVRTNDNVKLVLEGTMFWQVQDVAKLVSATSDPESDVWHHARSALIGAVSNTTLAGFMSSFNAIIKEAWKIENRENFYQARGVELQSMELTRFDCAESETAAVLQQIIQETTNRINRLTAQESDNEVRAAKLSMDIKLEKQRTELIQTQAENERLQAQMRGEADGMKLVKGASAFIEGLNESVPSVDSRIDLYKLHQNLQGRNADTKNLATGSAHLFLTPQDVNLKLQIGEGSEL